MRKFLLLLLLPTALMAQFSRTASYIISGPTLPATCNPLDGAIFFDDVAPGLGPYYCSATDTWSAMFASSGAGVTTGVTLLADQPVIGAGGSAIAVGTKTGTGTVFVTNTSPTLVTPTLGVALATSINGLTITTSTGTLTITNGKTLSVSNTLTFTGTDSSSVAFGTGGTVVYAGVTTLSSLVSIGTITTGVWNGTDIAVADGGTGAGTKTAAFDNLAPTATIAGSIIYWNGTNWVKLDGNASGTNCLTENASGVPSWATCGSGGGATTALDNLASVSINTSLLAQTGVDLGSTTKPFRDLYIFGSGTYATTYFKVTGTPTSTRTITIPDATGTLLNSGAAFTMGAFATDFTAATVSLPVVFVRTDTAQTYTAGVTQTFVPSATLFGLKVSCTTLPSTAASSGGIACDSSGNFAVNNNTNTNALVVVNGSGAALGTVPTAGRIPIWNGTNYSLGQDSDLSFSTDTLTATNIAVTTALTVGGLTISNPIPQNSKSAAYTTVLADCGGSIYHPSADTTARTWTIDSNANVAAPIGCTITFVNDTSGGVITIAITSDTLVLAGTGTTGSRSLAANGVATATKITSTRWIINGTGLT
jgi:hypothetical protein